MVIIAAIGAGLGVAARPDAHRPDAHVDRRHGLGLRRCRARDEGLERGDVEAAVGEGGVQAAPAATVDWLQAQMDR
jgi:hypothetical protein